MKYKHSAFFLAGLAAVLVTPAIAIEPPADDSPPPAAIAGADATLPDIDLSNAAGAAEQPASPDMDSAFLGVVSGEVSDALADQLSLKTGEGIVVRSLVPDGPAAKAGLAINDIVISVAGESIASPADISEKILTHKVGDHVALGIVHKGQPAEIVVTLGSRPAGMAAAGPQAIDPMHLEGLPKDLADRVRDAIAGNTGATDLQLGGMPDMDEAIRDIRRQMASAMAGALTVPNAVAGSGTHSSATVRMNDTSGSVEVKSENGAKEVTVRDSSDKVAWSGPWNTDEDKAAAPADVRQRIDSLNLDSSFKGGGLRLRLNRPADPDH